MPLPATCTCAKPQRYRLLLQCGGLDALRVSPAQVEALEEKGKAIILMNPVLKDIPSHSGIMGVRCRPLLTETET